MKNWLLLIYIVLSLINISAEWMNIDWLIIASKPLLLTTLSLWFYLVCRPIDHSFKRFILLGLIFSIGGDTLLLGSERNANGELFFMLGLASFLVAQLSYAYAFFQFGKQKKGTIRRQPLSLIPFLIYLGLLLSNLWPGIGNDLKIPVTVYALAISLMVVAAFNLLDILPRQVFWGLFIGVLLFLLSDSLIAINKFLEPVPLARIWIMLTYLVAQLLIAWYAMKMTTGLSLRKI